MRGACLFSTSSKVLVPLIPLIGKVLKVARSKHLVDVFWCALLVIAGVQSKARLVQTSQDVPSAHESCVAIVARYHIYPRHIAFFMRENIMYATNLHFKL